MRKALVVGLCSLFPLPMVVGAGDETLARLWQLGEVRSFDAEVYAAAAESSRVEVRRSCARLLGHLRNEGAVRLALRLSRDPDPMVRAEALASLGRLAPWLFQEPWKARVRKALAAGLKDQDLRVQEAAVWAWGAAGEAEEPFLEMLRHNQARSVRVAVLQNLWRTQGTQWPAVAARYAKSSQGELRWAALWSLSRKGGRELEATLPELLGDPQPALRLLACEAVRRHKIAVLAAQVVPLLGDPEESVRVAALNALAELGPEAAKVVTGKVVRDLPQWVVNENLQHPHLRVGAIRLAGSLGCCREQLERVVEEGGWAGGEAVVALARQQNRRLVEQELASPDAVFRRWAVLGLQYLAQSQELLQKAMGDEETRVRLAAAEVAGKLADPALAQPLRRLLGDRDAAVRVQAAESLAALGQPVEPAVLVTMLKKELEGGASEGAVALIRLLGKAEPLSAEAASALEQARAHPEPGIALAAWEELFRHGRLRAFPNRRPRQPLSWYDELIRFCQKPRYLEVVTVRGTFTVSLDLADAPFAAFALWQLAGKKFFDNLTVHRVVSNFVVQGGDPRGDGWGGPGFFLPDELSLKAFEVGSVGMALAGPDTGGSQFFVTLTPQPHLLGRYPRVGTVAAGLEVVQRLQVGDRILRVRAGEGPPPVPIPVWYGTLTTERLEEAFAEFRQHRQEYQPREEWLSWLRKAKLRYELVVAMGTWCSDSREQIPRLLKIHQVLGPASPFSAITLLGMDRSKRVVPAASFPFGPVEKVPTVVVTFGGAEVGRIVETPLAPTLEEDLVRILAPMEGWELPEEGVVAP